MQQSSRTMNRDAYLTKRIDASGDCWEWTGPTNGVYGRTWWAFAHRAVWEWLVGPIPEGLEIDHLCLNKMCVNPDHLEPVTSKENKRRNKNRSRMGGNMRVKTHCPQGHAYEGDNIYLYRGRRNCRTCSKRRSREFRQVHELYATVARGGME